MDRLRAALSSPQQPRDRRVSLIPIPMTHQATSSQHGSQPTCQISSPCTRDSSTQWPKRSDTSRNYETKSRSSRNCQDQRTFSEINPSKQKHPNLSIISPSYHSKEHFTPSPPTSTECLSPICSSFLS